MTQPLMPKKLKLNTSMFGIEHYASNTNTKTDVLFVTGDWNAKVGSQEIPGVTGKFSIGVQDEAGQRLTELCQENTLIITNTSYSNTRDDSTEIRLIISLVAEDGEALYSQQKET